MKKDLQKQLVENYQKRKSWLGENKFQAHSEIFSIEAGRAGIKRGERLLEIGFGEGLFLDWARYSGCDICGVEINHDFYCLAKERGHQVYLGQTQQVLSHSDKKYDGIFLFDVLEHLSLEEIADLFGFLKTILKEEGVILARFPNGGSPFGRLMQHSDATHLTVLTGSKIQDIIALSELVVKGVYNGARTKKSGAHNTRINRIQKWFAYRLRDIIQIVIGYLYYGENIPLDSNLTVLIGHDQEGL